MRTLMPCPVRDVDHREEPFGLMPSLEEHLVDLPRDGQLGLELLDPALRRGQLELLLGRLASLLTAVDRAPA